MYRAIRDFRKNHDWSNSANLSAPEFMTSVISYCRAAGVEFSIREKSVQPLPDYVFKCLYEVGVTLEKKPETMYSMGDFTVLGNPATARSMVFNMAVMEFAGIYPEVDNAYRRESPPVQAQPEPQELDEPDPAATNKSPEPSNELQQALAAREQQPRESSLIDRKTADGIPVLKNLFVLDGVPAEIASEAADDMLAAANECISRPMLQVLWTKNEDSFNFIRDYDPENYNKLLGVFRSISDDLSSKEQAVKDNIATSTEEPMKPRLRPVGRAARRRKKVA